MGKINPTLNALIAAGGKRFTRANYAIGDYAELVEEGKEKFLHLHIGLNDAKVKLDDVLPTGWKVVIK